MDVICYHAHYEIIITLLLDTQLLVSHGLANLINRVPPSN